MSGRFWTILLKRRFSRIARNQIKMAETGRFFRDSQKSAKDGY